MIRNLKVLGVALAAAFALSVVIASAASAQVGTLTTTGPTKLVSRQPAVEPTKNNRFTAFGASTTCSSAILTGHKYNVTPHTFVPNDVSKITVIPHYGSCLAAGAPATVDMNTCDYVLELGTTVAADEYGINATVKCNTPGDHINVTVFTSSAHTTRICTITIEPDETKDYTGFKAKDTTNGFVDITGTIEGIHAKKVGGGILCPAESTENAKLDTEQIVEGLNEAGAKTHITITHL